LAEIEPVFVEYCLRLAKMGCALNKEQVLTLSTDLIHGTKYAKQLVEFKRMLRLPENKDSEKVIIGEGWYQNFMKRNNEALTRQRLRVKDAK
jgi:hypothetical protein